VTPLRPIKQEILSQEVGAGGVTIGPEGRDILFISKPASRQSMGLIHGSENDMNSVNIYNNSLPPSLLVNKNKNRSTGNDRKRHRSRSKSPLKDFSHLSSESENDAGSDEEAICGPNRLEMPTATPAGAKR
jgi:hypothetical protein